MHPSILLCALILFCSPLPSRAGHQLAEAPQRSLWKRLAESFKPQSLATIVKALPRFVSGVLTDILEEVIVIGKSVVHYFDSKEFSVSARSIQESILGRLFYWDFIGTGLRIMRVQPDCQAKAACECGAYVFARNRRIAMFLKALRSHFQASSAHWPAMMAGLQGENCGKLFEECPRNFFMSW